SHMSGLGLNRFLSRSALWPAAQLAYFAHHFRVSSLTIPATASTHDRSSGLEDEVVLNLCVTGWTIHLEHQVVVEVFPTIVRVRVTLRRPERRFGLEVKTME